MARQHPILNPSDRRLRERAQATFLTVRDAADMLAVSESTIRRMIRRGQLRGGGGLVTRESLRRELERR